MTDKDLPAIWGAAEADTVLEAALAYRALGISVIPCRGKEPAVATWRSYQARLASNVLIGFWWEKGYLANLGIVCGSVSGNLVVMDLDGEGAFAAFARQFPHLVDTYTVRSGSGVGYHLYYTVDSLPKTTRVTALTVGNIELRANGHYVVAPPSVHPVTGRTYLIGRKLPVMRLTEMSDVSEWIKRLILEKHDGHMPPARTPASAGPKTPAQLAGRLNNPSGWAVMATRAEAAAVRLAGEGARNDRLNLAAFKLGQVIGAGLIDRDYVERELLAAAGDLAAADGAHTVERTIKSGLDAGIRNPRQV